MCRHGRNRSSQWCRLCPGSGEHHRERAFARLPFVMVERAVSARRHWHWSVEGELHQGCVLDPTWKDVLGL
jgi:hypothetical protein